VLHYRPFRNTDPRHLVDIWRSHSACRALVQPMSVGLLDDYVFAKLYFDREGLIVAELDGQPVGFVHAGFGPNERGSALDRGVGIIAMLMTHPLAAFEKSGANVEHELLARAEAYLVERGATRILLGGSGRNAPFYLGLYGGSALPGIVTSDESLSAFACDTANPASPLAAGYHATGHRTIWHRELATLRPVVDRTQMQIRRRANVEFAADPPAASWWEACVYGPMDRVRFDLVGRDGSAGPVGARWAWAEFWGMEAFSAKWGIRAMGLKRIEVDSAQRREGLATFLLGEALKQLHSQGVAVVEAQARDDDPSSAALFRKLGFVEVDRATLYEKAVSAASPTEANREAPTRCPVKA
jgi:ribosomal protein S18 acetylase RimI-like enzyme